MFLGQSWRLMGSSFGSSEAPGRRIEAARFEASWEVCCRVWGRLGSCWGRFGGVLRPLEGILEAPGGILMIAAPRNEFLCVAPRGSLKLGFLGEAIFSLNVMC